jgi:hypothetical protein
MEKKPVKNRTIVSRTTVIAAILLALYAGYFTASTFRRNSIYQTTVTLWKSAVQSAPAKRRTHENYGRTAAGGPAAVQDRPCPA